MSAPQDSTPARRAQMRAYARAVAQHRQLRDDVEALHHLLTEYRTSTRALLTCHTWLLRRYWALWEKCPGVELPYVGGALGELLSDNNWDLFINCLMEGYDTLLKELSQASNREVLVAPFETPKHVQLRSGDGEDERLHRHVPLYVGRGATKADVIAAIARDWDECVQLFLHPRPPAERRRGNVPDYGAHVELYNSLLQFGNTLPADVDIAYDKKAQAAFATAVCRGVVDVSAIWGATPPYRGSVTTMLAHALKWCRPAPLPLSREELCKVVQRPDDPIHALKSAENLIRGIPFREA